MFLDTPLDFQLRLPSVRFLFPSKAKQLFLEHLEQSLLVDELEVPGTVHGTSSVRAWDCMLYLLTFLRV
jgi:hypothetical protein